MIEGIDVVKTMAITFAVWAAFMWFVAVVMGVENARREMASTGWESTEERIALQTQVIASEMRLNRLADTAALISVAFGVLAWLAR